MTTSHDLQTYLERALQDGLAELSGEGRTERIHYIDADHSERWSDPEEKVRAELWAELIYKYDYPPERIDFEVNVPRRTPNDYADLVIYRDDQLKSPWFVFECKRADVSDAAFNQSIEQSCGYRASLGADYCGAVAGLTRRLLRFDNNFHSRRARPQPPHRHSDKLRRPTRVALLQEQAQAGPRRRPTRRAARRH